MCCVGSASVWGVVGGNVPAAPYLCYFDFMILKTDRRAMFMANRSAVR